MRTYSTVGVGVPGWSESVGRAALLWTQFLAIVWFSLLISQILSLGLWYAAFTESQVLNLSSAQEEFQTLWLSSIILERLN